MLYLLKDKIDGSLLSLPLLPPASTRIETNSVLKQESKAAVALTELRLWLQHHHNPKIFVNNMMLHEAISSSAIENVIVPFPKTLEALAVQAIKPDFAVAEVLRYREAYKVGLENLTHAGIIELKHIFQLVARLQGLNPLSEEQLAFPEDDNRYIKLLSNLCSYMNDSGSDISALIRMAVQHYQFEIIHPFYLENGRTGRLLNLLFLQQHGVLPYPVLPLSEFIQKNKIEYYHLHQQVKAQNEWAEWILFMLRGLEQTTRQTLNHAQEIQLQYQKITNLVQQKAPSIYSKSLIDLIFERPYCKIEYLEEFGIAKRKAAGKYLHTLEQIGVLQMMKIGKENIFINTFK